MYPGIYPVYTDDDLATDAEPLGRCMRVVIYTRIVSNV